MRNKYEIQIGIVERRDDGTNRNYTRTFDKRNRLKSSTDAYSKTAAFTYDAANNLKSLTDAGNKTTNYNYDQQNRLDTVAQNSSTIADYDWYSDGLLKQVKYSETSKRDYNYDNADRVSNITNTIGTGSESFDYGYDANSNRETETRNINGAVSKTIAYNYDQLNRLESASYTANSATNQLSYTYDAVGNRKTETGADQNGVAISKTADYDDLDRLTQLTDGSLVSDFEYDDNSNLTKVKLNGTDNETFEYDIRNQLSKYTSIGNGITADYDYDFERKRLSKTVSNIRRDYVYAGNQVINEYLADNLNASYGIGSGEIVKSDFAGEGSRNYFSDALGSITSLADDSSSLISRNDYDSFGEIVSSTGLTQNSVTYTGQRLDVESGLMALGNGERYYNPSYGRFIQQDSYAGMPDMPQSLNRFSYGYNNPNSYTDPSGNVAENNRGSIAKSAREYGLNKDGETSNWGVFKNTVSRTGYDLWNLVSLGTLEREEENMAAFESGEITAEEARWNTFKNGSLAAAKVGLMVATAGTGNALLAGAGLATRVGGGALLGVADQFGNDVLEMGFGFRNEFSSVENYALAGVLGGAFGAAGPGKSATAYAKNNNLSLRTELKFLGKETKSLAQTTGQITRAFGRGIAKPTSGNMNTFGLQDVAEKLSNGVNQALKSPALKNSPYHPDRVNARIKKLWNNTYSKKPWKKDAYHGKKPTYRNLGHHDPSSGNFRGGGEGNTTVLPRDAEMVYQNAIPRSDGKVWYGRNSQKEFYRYSTDVEGFVHWSGRESSPLGLKIPPEIKARFKNLDKDLEGK